MLYREERKGKYRGCSVLRFVLLCLASTLIAEFGHIVWESLRARKDNSFQSLMACTVDTACVGTSKQVD